MNDDRCAFASRKIHSCVRLPLLGCWSRLAGDILPETLGRAGFMAKINRRCQKNCQIEAYFNFEGSKQGELSLIHI